jgi:hypothetical protein
MHAGVPKRSKGLGLGNLKKPNGLVPSQVRNTLPFLSPKKMRSIFWAQKNLRIFLALRKEKVPWHPKRKSDGVSDAIKCHVKKFLSPALK